MEPWGKYLPAGRQDLPIREESREESCTHPANARCRGAGFKGDQALCGVGFGWEGQSEKGTRRSRRSRRMGWGSMLSRIRP